jgi:hypothetical protein
MVNLSGWNKNNILKFTIDNTYIDEDLTDFPILINLSELSGKNNYDCTKVIEELSTTVSGVANYSNMVSVYINFENGSIQDKSINEHLVQSIGGGAVSTTFKKKFGEYGALIPLNHYFTISLQEDLIISTNDFTVHCWFYPRSGTNSSPAFEVGDYTSGVVVSYNGSTGFYWSVGGAYTLVSYTLVFNEWMHVAATRKEGIARLFINGIKIDEKFWSGAINPTRCTLGRDFDLINSTFDGYLDEFIVINGHCLWQDSFTPPMEPLILGDIGNLKVAFVYPQVQRHLVNDEWLTYDHGVQEQLYCEIERWSLVSVDAQLWVKVPKVLADQPTDIFMYYDSTQPANTTYIGRTLNLPAKQVWLNGYVGVFHLSQTPLPGLSWVLDSTENNNHGVGNSIIGTHSVSAFVGKAIEFAGAPYSISIPASTPLSITNNITIEGFIKAYTNGQAVSVAHKGIASASGDVYTLYKSTGNTINFALNDSAQILGSNVINHEWFSLAATYDMTQRKIFKNGITVVSGTFSSPINENTGPLYIGLAGVTYSTGLVKDVRISNVARSQAWIKATMYTSKDQLLTISNPVIFKISGSIKAFGFPAQRDVYLYERHTGELIQKTTADVNGFYTIYTEKETEHNIVCYHNDAPPYLNDLIISKVIPVEPVEEV